MAFRHGRYAELTIGGTALTTFCDSIDLNIDVDTSETSTFGTAWKTHIVGQAGGNLTLKGSYDPTATTGPAAFLTGLIGAAAASAIYYPGGNTAGQIKHTFDSFVTSYKESSAVGSKVTFDAGLIATGAIVTAAVSA